MYILRGNVTITDTDIHHHVSSFVSACRLRRHVPISAWDEPKCLSSTLDSCCCLYESVINRCWTRSSSVCEHFVLRTSTLPSFMSLWGYCAGA
jgi:hypothetical protein